MSGGEAPAPATPRPPAWTGRSRGTGLGYAIFFHTLRVLGRRAGYALLWPVTLYFFLFARAGRRASAAYLTRLLGPRTRVQRQLDTWRHFHALGRSLVDRLLIMAGGGGAFTFEHEGKAELLAAHARGRGLMLISAHVGSWAIAADAIAELAPTTVVFDNEAEGIRRFFARNRRAPPKLIPIGDSPASSLAILGALRAGEAVAMLADRARGGGTIRVPFLGAPADFALGPFLTAALAEAPVAFTFAAKLGPARHRFVADAPFTIALDPRLGREASLRPHVERFARELEAWIGHHPYQWYNFYDFWAG